MTMTEKFKILGKFIKDLSSETPDVETYLFVRERINKYQLVGKCFRISSEMKIFMVT